jgi:endonuclease/exonuclease/phosphatase family metal-dependent hydrolase
VNKILSRFADQGEAALMGGDFNLLPSMSAYRRVSERNREYYNSGETEIAPLLAQFSAVPSLQEADGEDHERWYTHMANHNLSKVPDKTIDYIFTTGGLVLGEHYIRSADVRSISDHLPVVAYFILPERP